MSDQCDPKIFSDGDSIACLDACRYRAENWVQQVAKMSGQPMDWHYSGGIVNVLYLGNYNKVVKAIYELSSRLSEPIVRLENECGSCSGTNHRPGNLLKVFGNHVHGLYRQGDSLPDDVIGVITH